MAYGLYFTAQRLAAAPARASLNKYSILIHDQEAPTLANLEIRQHRAALRKSNTQANTVPTPVYATLPKHNHYDVSSGDEADIGSKDELNGEVPSDISTLGFDAPGVSVWINPDLTSLSSCSSSSSGF